MVHIFIKPPLASLRNSGDNRVEKESQSRDDGIANGQDGAERNLDDGTDEDDGVEFKGILKNGLITTVSKNRALWVLRDLDLQRS